MHRPVSIVYRFYLERIGVLRKRTAERVHPRADYQTENGRSVRETLNIPADSQQDSTSSVINTVVRAPTRCIAVRRSSLAFGNALSHFLALGSFGSVALWAMPRTFVVTEMRSQRCADAISILVRSQYQTLGIDAPRDSASFRHN